MSKEKKSFVLYNDNKTIFDMLSNEQAGQLIKHIFDHANGIQAEAAEFWLKIAFEPIRLQMVRDGLKYVETCEKNKENARKRKHATASDRMRPHAKHADNDNDNDNDNDTDTDNEREGVNPLVKPALSDLLVFMSKEEGQRFLNHYNANGWKVGRNKMVDWKQAAEKWANNEFSTDKKKPKINYYNPNDYE
jgi:hypothetical protein